MPEWEKLLSAQVIFQSHFPEAVLVGGAEILAEIEREAGWKTNKLEPPVLILGNFQGVRTGIRQLIRKRPLETTVVRGLRIPTIEEILRIKAYLIVRRNTTRDFVDFVALFDHLGFEKSLDALSTLDDLYPQEGEELLSRQLAIQLAEPKPWDLIQTNLSHYKALKKPYTDWNEVKRRSGAIGLRILESLLSFKNTPPMK